MKAFKVLLAGSGVVLSWASAFPAIRVAAPALGAIGLSIVRLTVAALALLVVARFAHVRPPERRHAWLLVAAAFFGMTAYQVLLNAGELHVPAGTASIVVASAPLVSVAIAALALRERLTVTKIAGSAVAIAGVAVVCLSRSGASVTSAIWIVVGAAVVQGIYHPLIKPPLRTRTALEVATYAMTIGAVMALPLLPWGWERLATAPASAWGAAVYLALVPSALGFVLWGYAVANLSMATSTSLLYLVPAVAVLIAFVWLGEAPQPSELFGGLVILVGVGLIGQGDRLRTRLRARRAPTSVSRRRTATTEPDVADARAPARRVASHAHDRDVPLPSLPSRALIQRVPQTHTLVHSEANAVHEHSTPNLSLLKHLPPNPYPDSGVTPMYSTPSIDLSCSHCGAPRIYQLVPLEERPTEAEVRRLPHKIVSIDLTCSRCGSSQTYKIVPDSVVHPVSDRPKAATTA